MDTTKTNEDEYLMKLVRLGRQLEMAGFYNAAKLFWAAAFSEEMHGTNEGIHMSPEEIQRDIADAIGMMKERGASPTLIAALERGEAAVRAVRSIPFTEIGDVHVCRACGELVVGDQPERCPNCGGYELTFRTFPAVHYLEPLPPQVALEALATVPTIIEGIIGDMTEAEMNQQPSPGEWSFREVMGHLYGTQELIAFRVKKILEEDNPSLRSLGVADLAPQENVTAQDLFQRYKFSREAMVARLRTISPADWWRTGVHEEFATVTLLQQASYFAKHDHAHLTQIEQIRRAIGA